MHVEIRRMIAAPPDRVWSIITDADALSKGGLGILTIGGTITSGSTIRVRSEAAPKREFALSVRIPEPTRRMVWEGGMPFGLFRGVRTFELLPCEGGTDFSMREEFSGWLLPLIARSMPDLQPSFEKFGDGLKRLAEG